MRTVLHQRKWFRGGKTFGSSLRTRIHPRCRCNCAAGHSITSFPVLTTSTLLHTRGFASSKQQNYGAGSKRRRPNNSKEGGDALSNMLRHLAVLQQAVAGRTVPSVWEQQKPSQSQKLPPSFTRDLLRVDQLLRDNISEGSIRANGKHRREFSILVELLLRLYTYCDSSEHSDAVDEEVYYRASSWPGLLQDQYRGNLLVTHTQSLVLLAAQRNDWSAAVRWYEIHLDPSVATPAPGSHTILGLYCVGKAAAVAPAESVFATVQNLALVAPMETEQRK